LIKLSILGREIILSTETSYPGRVGIVYHFAEISPEEFKLLSNRKSPEGYYTSVMVVDNGYYLQYWVMARDYNTGDTVQIAIDMRDCERRLSKFNQTKLFPDININEPNLFS
jgi:hypothetical protein